jgi:hypothetical protein
MAPSFDHLREADLDDDEFNEDDIDVSDLRERFDIQLEQGYDTFVVIDGLPEVTEEQKPKLVKFLLRKLNTVGKTREDLIYMPMGEDGKSLRYIRSFNAGDQVCTNYGTGSHSLNTLPPPKLLRRLDSSTWFPSIRSTPFVSIR